MPHLDEPSRRLDLFPDPLERDAPEDATLLTSRRRLIRVALVACETGARFAREGIRQDPMAWMLVPRRMFGGAAALDACADLDDCTRALVLHGLGLGLDAASAGIDDLLADDHGPVAGEGGVADEAVPAGCARTASQCAVRVREERRAA